MTNWDVVKLTLRVLIVPAALGVFIVALVLFMVGCSNDATAPKPVPHLDYGSCATAVDTARALYGAPRDSTQELAANVLWTYHPHHTPAYLWFSGGKEPCQLVVSSY